METDLFYKVAMPTEDGFIRKIVFAKDEITGEELLALLTRKFKVPIRAVSTADYFKLPEDRKVWSFAAKGSLLYCYDSEFIETFSDDYERGIFLWKDGAKVEGGKGVPPVRPDLLSGAGAANPAFYTDSGYDLKEFLDNPDVQPFIYFKIHADDRLFIELDRLRSKLVNRKIDKVKYFQTLENVFNRKFHYYLGREYRRFDKIFLSTVVKENLMNVSVDELSNILDVTRQKVWAQTKYDAAREETTPGKVVSDYLEMSRKYNGSDVSPEDLKLDNPLGLKFGRLESLSKKARESAKKMEVFCTGTRGRKPKKKVVVDPRDADERFARMFHSLLTEEQKARLLAMTSPPAGQVLSNGSKTVETVSISQDRMLGSQGSQTRRDIYEQQLRDARIGAAERKELEASQEPVKEAAVEESTKKAKLEVSAAPDDTETIDEALEKIAMISMDKKEGAPSDDDSDNWGCFDLEIS